MTLDHGISTFILSTTNQCIKVRVFLGVFEVQILHLFLRKRLSDGDTDGIDDERAVFIVDGSSVI